MIFYTLFFVVPLLMIIFYDDADVSRFCYVIGYFTQLFFFGYEMVQARATGLNYF